MPSFPASGRSFRFRSSGCSRRCLSDASRGAAANHGGLGADKLRQPCANCSLAVRQFPRNAGERSTLDCASGASECTNRCHHALAIDQRANAEFVEMLPPALTAAPPLSGTQLA